MQPKRKRTSNADNAEFLAYCELFDLEPTSDDSWNQFVRDSQIAESFAEEYQD